MPEPAAARPARAPQDAAPLRALRAIGDALARIPRLAGLCLALLWAWLVYRLSSGPPPATPIGWRWAFAFNLAHAPLYGMLALLAALALPRSDGAGARRGWPRLTRGAQGVVVLLVVLYGLSDEWHQASTPERMASWRDVVTDLAGAAATLAVAAYLARPDARGSGLALRLALGALACLAAAHLATSV